MNAIYDSHIIKWQNVRWGQDGQRLLETLKTCRGSQVITRVKQSGRMIEVAHPVEDLAGRLRQGHVNLQQSFDVELITREPAWMETAGKSPVAMEEKFVDRHDENQLQWNGERGTGCLAAGRLRNAPMFFRSNGMHADLVDLFPGKTLFLVLNGGSLAGFDWGRLKKPGICSFGVNNGAHAFRPNFWTCVDDPTRFMPSIWEDPAIMKFVPMAHFEKPVWDSAAGTFSKRRVREFSNVFGYRRNEAFHAAQWLFEDTINWGNHSKRGGGRSVMLAALRIAFLLGFRRVCLLGCDFHMDEKHRYWFEEDRTKSAISNNQNSYQIMTGYFEQLRPHFEEADFKILNCNPESRLKVFPQADLDEELKAAEIDVSASTAGMYVDRYKDSKPKPQAPARQPTPAPQLRKSPVPGLKNGRKADLPLLNHLIRVIQSSPARSEPFVHLRLESVFPAEIYRSMLEKLPEDSAYHELRHRDAIQPDGRSARLRFGFGAEEMGRLPAPHRAFWLNIFSALQDRRVEAAFLNALKEGFRHRFGEVSDKVVLRPVIELIRDLPGYRIGVHTDIFQKAITVQFYLPADASQKELGTTYYRRAAGGGFAEFEKMEFMPATGHAFAVHDHSFHGVDTPIPPGEARNSLMLTYYLRK